MALLFYALLAFFGPVLQSISVVQTPFVNEMAEAAQKPTNLERHRAALLTYMSALQPISASQRLTMGVELEGVFRGPTRDDAVNAIITGLSEEFKKHIYIGAKIEVEHYDYKTRRGEPRKGSKIIVQSAQSSNSVEWNIRDDGSIQPPAGSIGIEIVSPILRSASDVDKYERIRDFLSRFGFRAQPDSAALQIHVGMTETGPIAKDKETSPEKIAEVLMTILTFSKIEKQLMQIFEINPNRQKFSMPTPPAMVGAILNGQIPLKGTNLYDVIEKYYNYRYWALNVHALFQFGTVEIRFANSTLDQQVTESLLDLSYKLVQAVRTKDQRLFALLYKYSESDIPIEEVAYALNIKIKKMANTSNCDRLLGGKI